MASMNKKQAEITFLYQELEIIARMVADEEAEAAFLIEETKKEARNALFPITSELTLLKLFCKQLENTPYKQKDHDREYRKNKPLSLSLQKVEKPARLLLVLYYYKGFNIRQLAKIMGCSEKEGKQQLMTVLPIWKSSSFAIENSQNLQQQWRNEWRDIEISSLNNDEQKHAFKKKRLLSVAAVLLFLFLGGTVNETLKAEAEVKPGLDLMKLYNESSRITEIENEIAEIISEAGYENVSFYIDSQVEYAYLDIEGKENEAKQKDIITMVENEMKERNLSYYLEPQFYVMEEADIEEVDAEADEETDISSEITDKLLNKIDIEMGGYGSWVFWTADAWYIHIPTELEADKKQKVKNIAETVLEEYEDKRKLIFEEYSYKEQEKQGRWNNVGYFINTAFLMEEEYLFQNINIYSTGGIMKIEINLQLTNADKDREKIAREVKRSIAIFLENKKIKEVTGDDPYKIVILGTNNKEIITD